MAIESFDRCNHVNLVLDCITEVSQLYCIRTIKIEKIIGIQKSEGKVRKKIFDILRFHQNGKIEGVAFRRWTSGCGLRGTAI